jgi:hypothetical protein
MKDETPPREQVIASPRENGRKKWFGRGGVLGNYGLLLSEYRFGLWIADFIAILVVLAAISAVTNQRRHAYSLAILSLAAAIPQALDPHVESSLTGVLANLASMIFLIYLVVIILRDIFLTTQVSMDTLVGSVCGYLLLSAVFAAAYSTLVLLQPDSFIVDERLTLDPSKLHFQGAHFDVLLYFSVITLTTVGFGDIIPATTFARELVSAEAIMGQVYITMIVARLVGMHLTASLR